MFVRGERHFGNLVMQCMSGKVIDGVDWRLGDHLSKVGEELDFDVGLKVGQINIADCQWIARGGADRWPLSRSAVAMDVHPGVVEVSRTQGGDAEVITTCLTQQLISA